jgi:hypothetical protein
MPKKRLTSPKKYGHLFINYSIFFYMKRLAMKPGAPKKVLAIQGGKEVVAVTGTMK